MRHQRITPKQVLDSYRLAGMDPRNDLYIDRRAGSLCGCALGAVYVAKFGPKPDATLSDDEIDQLYNKIDVWADQTYGIEYVAGFTGGFDGPDKPTCFAEGRALQGHQDGVAVARAMAEAFPQTN